MRKKRVYGEGSITERKDGRVQVSVPDPNAKGGRRYAYAKDQREAEKIRRQLLAEVEQGKVPASRKPFKVHAEEWLEMRKHDYKPNSYINAVTRMNAHFIPAFGHVPLNKLTHGHIQKLYNKLLDQGLNPNTIRQYHETLSTCLDSAVKQRKIEINPCSYVELPKRRKSKNSHLSLVDAEKLVEACKGHRLLEALVPVTLASAAREGELLALTWDDIDMEQGVMRINKTLTQKRDEHGKYSLVDVTPKSQSSVRDILLPDFATEALRAHKVRQMKTAWASGKQPGKLVFCTKHGGYIWPNNLRYQLQRIAVKVDMDITFHDLRHTSATLLLEEGVAPNVVQERLGHSDIKTTLGTYGHVTQKTQDKSVKTLQGLFTRDKNTNSEAI